MKRILKRSCVSACLCEAVAFLLVVIGIEADDDIIGLTILGTIP